MSDVMAVLITFSFAMLGYVYVGYPVLLRILVRLRGAKPVRRGDALPSVSLVISAYNEASVMRRKLENALALTYPAKLLEVVVVSDASDDSTDAIVREYADRGVRLSRQPERRGKTAGLNRTVPTLSGDIVAFSDANALYQPDALLKLVRNFADPHVGCVTGEARYLVGARTAADVGERVYWGYEIHIKRLETALDSMVGVDGAFYAIRHDLFVPPPSDTILDDMAIPMAIIRAGRRVVFEPAARAHERGSDSAKEEFARKSRVIAGAVQFLSRYDSVIPLNAVQVMFSMVSHKALRWLSPLLAACAFAASAALAPTSAAYAAAAVGQGALLLLGAAGCIPALRRASLVGLAHYFCLVQIAAGFGFVRGLRGSQSVRWRRFNRVPVELA